MIFITLNNDRVGDIQNKNGRAIEFNGSKIATFSNKIIPVTRDGDWYLYKVENKTGVLFHSSWCNKIEEVDIDNVFCLNNMFLVELNETSLRIICHDFSFPLGELKTKLKPYVSTVFYRTVPKFPTVHHCAQCKKELNYFTDEIHGVIGQNSSYDWLYLLLNGGVAYFIDGDHLTNFVCNDCFVHVKNCDYCGRSDYVFFDNKISIIEDKLVCDQCTDIFYKSCVCCNRKFLLTKEEQHELKNEDDDFICKDCQMKKNMCYYCKKEFDPDDLFIYYERKTCPICFEEAKETYNRNPGRHDMKFKNHVVFTSKNETSPVTFGFEFEVEINRTYKIKNVLNAIDTKLNREGNSFNQYAYHKHDGSLEYGFEVVTQPMSWRWITENEGVFRRLFWFRKYYGDAKDTCGFHIHISKNAVPNSDVLYKLLKWFYNPTNKTFILKISERNCNSDWIKKYCFWIYDNEIIKNQSETFSNGDVDRHSAINLSNPHTIEFRIFRGTLQIESFYKNIQFVISLIEYAKEASIRNLTYNAYCTWLEDHKDEYHYIYTFIKENKLCA